MGGGWSWDRPQSQVWVRAPPYNPRTPESRLEITALTPKAKAESSPVDEGTLGSLWASTRCTPVHTK